jgi:predicted nucleic acid-binding protein
MALLRLLTTKVVMGKDVQTTTGAWEIYDRCRTDGRIGFLTEPDRLDPKFRALAKCRYASPNVWADAYLAALASAGGLKLVTFDKAFRSRSAACLILG